MNFTPNSNRLHIAIFGKSNSGKSSLINALTNQEAALVSEVAGTTADPVIKAMEVRGIGACVFIDTAGFDDKSELGELRISATKKAVDKTDIAVLIFADDDFSLEKEWISLINSKKIPILPVINKADILNYEEISKKIKTELKLSPIIASTVDKRGINEILSALVRLVPEDYEAKSLTAHIVKPNDVVMLVMPQDCEAPKGRLILPQVQVTRDLLDNDCTIISCTPDTMQTSLNALKAPPDLIITDSQAFKATYELTPKESRLTSFSIIMAAAKGDINSYVEGAAHIDSLSENSRILIAEACTHAPLSEDIGRVKIPALLKKKFGEKIEIDIVSGTDFPDNLSSYNLIIHCGGCMFNRKYLMTRIKNAAAQNIPITNYGIFLAKMNGILDKVLL